MPDFAKQTLAELLAGGVLDERGARAVFDSILKGEWDGAQIGAMLALIQKRGVSPGELTGAARAMREHVTPVPISAEVARGVLIDTCGTGGAPKTFNVSTAAAFVVAGAAGPLAGGAGLGTAEFAGRRVYVAKHGNRGRTGRGSAEVLACLGAALDAPPEAQSELLERCGVCFCFAVHHHPAMRHAAPVRHALGFPTIFNLLGPLTNPAGVPRQLMGVFRPEYVDLVAQAHAALGTEKAIVLHSEDGLDEISIFAPTRAALVVRGAVTRMTIDGPSLLASRERARLEDVQAADAADAAELIRGVIEGTRGGRFVPARDMVVLNAAAALVVADAAGSMEEGVKLAEGAIERGDAARVLGEFLRG